LLVAKTLNTCELFRRDCTYSCVHVAGRMELYCGR